MVKQSKNSGFGNGTDNGAGGLAGKPTDAGRNECGREEALVGNLVQLHKLQGSLLARLQKNWVCRIILAELSGCCGVTDFYRAIRVKVFC